MPSPIVITKTQTDFRHFAERVDSRFLNSQSNGTEPFFHREGHEIIDPNGKQFQIKGANVSCWL